MNRPTCLAATLTYPPRQGADSLSLKKVIEGAMKKMENPTGGSN